jgi:hypothetical protein
LYAYFDVVVGLAWSEDPESCDGGSTATGRGSHAGQVKGDDPDKKGYCVTCWGLGVDLTTLPCKTWICFETSVEASESGGRRLGGPWPENGPKRHIIIIIIIIMPLQHIKQHAFIVLFLSYLWLEFCAELYLSWMVCIECLKVILCLPKCQIISTFDVAQSRKVKMCMYSLCFGWILLKYIHYSLFRTADLKV